MSGEVSSSYEIILFVGYRGEYKKKGYSVLKKHICNTCMKRHMASICIDASIAPILFYLMVITQSAVIGSKEMWLLFNK